jgi:hypothetical protein
LSKTQKKSIIKAGYIIITYFLFFIVIAEMIEENLLITIALENGLSISIFDDSKKIAADRWQVNLKARIIIVTDKVHFTRMDTEKRLEILQVVGEQINYEKKLTRNFVDEKKKEEIIKALYESFLQITRPYFSHSQFAERFVLKTYADSLEKRKWVKSWL